MPLKMEIAVSLKDLFVFPILGVCVRLNGPTQHTPLPISLPEAEVYLKFPTPIDKKYSFITYQRKKVEKVGLRRGRTRRNTISENGKHVVEI